MATRNMQKKIAEGDQLRKDNHNLDLSLKELHQLTDNYKDLPISDSTIAVIMDAYLTGLAVGTQNGKKA